MKICFFARVANPEILSTVDFYAQDIRVLRELGHEVIVETRFGRVPPGCDLYYVWWWTYAINAAVLARLQRKHVVITGAFDYSAPPRLEAGHSFFTSRPRWQQLLIRASAKLATLNMPHSDYEIEQIRTHLGIQHIFKMPLGVDVERFSPGSGPRENFFFNVAWSGQVNGARKCLGEIVEAFALFAKERPETRLVMAGRPGEYQPILQAIVKKHGLESRVDFIGVISDEEKLSLMRRCAAYVQPTLYEGFGLAIAEALACGTPTITSNVGAVGEVVGDGALIVDGSDVGAIKDAMCRLVDDPVFAEELGARGRKQIVDAFSMDRKRAAVEAMFERLKHA